MQHIQPKFNDSKQIKISVKLNTFLVVSQLFAAMKSLDRDEITSLTVVAVCEVATSTSTVKSLVTNSNLLVFET